MDGDGVVEFPAVAGTLAGVETDPAADTREGVLPEDRLPGLLEEPLGGEHLDFADVLPGRAGGAAGRRLFLVAGPQVTPGACLVGFRGLGRAGHDVKS